MTQTAIDCARDAVAVTPSDTLVFTPPLNGFIAGSTSGGAVVTIITPAGNSVAVTVVAGVTVPIQTKQIMATGTTASSITGLK